jgi:selenium donor protein
VTGSVHPEKIITNAGAAPGDAIILTKPIGTGILTTGMKRGMTETGAYETMIRNMMLLNKMAAGVMAHFPVNACTDVTGFGLLGHLKEMVKGSHTGARIGADIVPLFPEVEKLAAAGIIPGGTYSNLESVEDVVDWDPEIPAVMKLILADAQTSGGLLIAVPQDLAGKMLRDLHQAGVPEATVIGAFTESEPGIKVARKLLRN